MDNRAPFIYKTTDFGQTWTKISGGLPRPSVGVYAWSPRIRTGRECCSPGLETRSTTRSTTAPTGRSSKGLPHAPVTWMVCRSAFTTSWFQRTAAGLHSRDITTLEQMAPTWVGHYGFVVSLARRCGTARRRAGVESVQLKDPPGQFRRAILDAPGRLCARYAVPGAPGLNRRNGIMHYDPPRVIALRTTPPDNPHIWEEPRFRGQDSRRCALGDSRGAGRRSNRSAGKVHRASHGRRRIVHSTVRHRARSAIDGSVADIAVRAKQQLRFATGSIRRPTW